MILVFKTQVWQTLWTILVGNVLGLADDKIFNLIEWQNTLVAWNHCQLFGNASNIFLLEVVEVTRLVLKPTTTTTIMGKSGFLTQLYLVVVWLWFSCFTSKSLLSLYIIELGSLSCSLCMLWRSSCLCCIPAKFAAPPSHSLPDQLSPVSSIWKPPPLSVLLFKPKSWESSLVLPHSTLFPIYHQLLLILSQNTSQAHFPLCGPTATSLD